jgi:hypothetical protein
MAAGPFLCTAAPPLFAAVRVVQRSTISPAVGATFNEVLISAGAGDVSDFAVNQADFREQAVPEPASLTLLGIGMMGFLGYRWRRRQLAA